MFGAGGLAAAGTHLHECMTCCMAIESEAFTEFCYAHYQVTGDGEVRPHLPLRRPL